MDILGVDIGGSGIKGAVVDTLTGELKTERIRIPTPQPATPKAVAETLKQLVDQIGFKGPIGCGFPARVIDGEVLTAANIDKSWINVKVEELFTSVVGQQVYVANDADVAGLAELTFGAVKDYKGPVLFLTIGTGIGSALFINGQWLPLQHSLSRYPGQKLPHPVPGFPGRGIMPLRYRYAVSGHRTDALLCLLQWYPVHGAGC